MAKKKEAPNVVEAPKVVVAFRDINDFSKEYKPGQDASGFAAERLKDLIKRGLVK